MKFLKKTLLSVIAMMLAMVMAFSVVACGSGNSDSDNKDKPGTEKPGTDNPGGTTTQWTVTFDSDGGSAVANQLIKDGGKINYQTPTKEGHKFLGWYTEEGELFDKDTPVKSNLKLIAHWEADSVTDPVTKWTVTFDSNGGTTIDAQTVEDGLSIDYKTPVKSGYKFLGWFTESGVEFAPGTPVKSNLKLIAHWQEDPSVPPVKTYTVKFMVGTEVYASSVVESGKTVSNPGTPEKSGQLFTGWYEGSSSTPFNFNTPITADITLTAGFAPLSPNVVASGAYNESLYVVWEGKADGATVEYTVSGQTDWTEVDAPLIRNTDEGARVDILGLAEGTYDVKITPAVGNEVEVSSIKVTAYDRSGYAHFKYDEGVGAYKDDGTIKEGTLVIYVTEENKNDILDYAYVDGEKVDISQYMKATAASAGVTLGQQKGIGELLNNRRYAGNDRWNVGIAALCNQYGSVAIRIIGTVSAEKSGTMESTINGLTTYDSTENGGSVGDNGRMARMVNAHDLTIEGVGEDASMFGWGVHFIASDTLHKQPRSGKGFEVRNITFENYPEDAVGMEGIQGDKIDETGSVTSGASSVTADLLSPVERCWIHNNTFLPGYASNPTESDKKEGDGSCDFKRGYYYTLSYNYFENCHKTNLIGSSDKSLQFNITMHHNWWNNCGSRMPLVRNANVHFYNNYFSGDMSATPKPSLSYVTSARANSYMFSENNYFDGAKQVVLLASGGQVKSYGDMFYATFGTYSGTIVSNRDTAISNNCKFQKKGWDLSKFDTNPDQFYYKNGKSDCLLDDAVTARKNAMMYAGANGQGVTDTAMNKYTPSKTVVVNESGINIPLPTSKNDTEVSGVLFRNISGVSSGTIKFKGQGITFTLSGEAQLTVTTTTIDDSAPELVGADGTVYAHKFTGTLTIVLQPGTYFIASGQKEKEAVITSLRFDDTSASSAERVKTAVDAINALAAATPELTETYEALLNTAQTAYGALTPSEKAAFDSAIYAKLTKAISDFGALQVAEFERLVSLIGTVTKDSYDAINAAQQAYDKLSGDLREQASEAKATLDKAWEAYEQFAVQNVIDLIDAFVAKVNNVSESTDRETVKSLIDEGNSILAAYEALSSDTDETDEDDETVKGESQQSQVTNYSELVAAIAKLEEFNNVFDFQDALAYFKNGHTVTYEDVAQVTALTDAYNNLTDTQKNALSSEDKELYSSVLEQFDAVKPKIIGVYFTREKGNDGNPVINTSTEGEGMFEFLASCNGSNDSGTITTSDGQTISVTNGLKMESKTEFGIHLGTNGTATVKIYVKGTNGVKVNGTGYKPVNGVVELKGLSGDLVLTQNSSSDVVFYIEVIFD